MASRGQSLTIEYVAWDTSANAGKTGDVANHTLRWVKDGTSSAPTNAASEVDSTNAPGLYKLTLTSAECTCDFGALAGKSATANISIIPISVCFEQLPTAVAGANTGLPVLDANLEIKASSLRTNNDKTGYALTAGEHTNIATDTQAGLTAQGFTAVRAGYMDTLNGLVAAIWASASRTLTAFGFNVTVATNNDKTGYSLSAAEETAIASAIATRIYEGTLTHENMQRIMLSALAGILAGAATTTVTTRDQANGKNRISATVDASGNRSAVTVDGT